MSKRLQHIPTHATNVSLLWEELKWDIWESFCENLNLKMYSKQLIQLREKWNSLFAGTK